MYTLGINFSHHTSVALLKDNEVVFFCLEERFNRIKEYGGNVIPQLALEQVKNFTKKIDFLFSVSGSPDMQRKSIDLLKTKGVSVARAHIKNANHHLYHAAAGFYLSPFDTATCMVIDGAGFIDPIAPGVRASETTSYYQADYQRGLVCTDKQFTIGIYDPPGINSLVDNYPEKKVTAAQVTAEQLQAFRLKFRNINNVVATNDLDTGIKYHCGASKIARSLKWKGRNPDGKMMGLSGYGCLDNATSEEVMAYQTQKDLEQDFIIKAKYVTTSNLVLSGGCALNILGNSLIKKTYPNINVFIDPIAHDGTIALGAAAYGFYKTTRCKEKLVVDPYTGLDYKISKKDIYECVRKYSV